MHALNLLRHRTALWGLVILWGTLALACRPLPSYERPGPPAVAPDAEFNRLLTEGPDGWTGADGAVSIQLPDDRSLWLFGDSFLGRIEPDGTRTRDTPFIRNSALIQAHGRMKPLYGQRDGSPAALFQPDAPEEWYWPGDGTLQGERVFVFLHRFRQMRPGRWGWQWVGTNLAVLQLPGLRLASIQPLTVPNGVRYGAALLEQPEWVLIYGVVEKAGRKDLHLARAPAASLAGGAWQFFDGRRWSLDPDRSAALLTGVGSQFSVVPFGSQFVLITMDNRTPFSGRLVAYSAPRPEGPFQGPVFLYAAPEAGPAVAAYNPFVHSQFTQEGRILVSYNVNHLHDPSALYRDARLYRPRFVRVDLARCLPFLREVEHEFGGSWR